MNRRTDLRTVGQIVSAIGLLHIFPSDEKVGEFLVPLLTSVPGCCAASLCFRRLDNPIGSLRGEQCIVCVKEQRHLAETSQYSCRLVEQCKVLAYPLETSVRQYGHLVLSVQNLDEYKRYEPFVRNLGNVLAIILENRRQQQALLEGRGLLEQRITERTEELERANEELRKEITDRKQAEEALQKSQRLLSETERIGKVGGWELNIDTRGQSWTEEIYNIHEVDLTYNPTLENGINFYTPTSFPIIYQAVKRAIEDSEPFDLELEIITAKGNLRYVHAIGKPDLDHHRVYGFFQDITARKQAEAKSRSDQQLLQIVIDNSPYLIYAKNLDGKFILASQSLSKFFNQQGPEQLLGKTSHDFLPKEIADQHRTNDLEVITRQSVVSFEETASTKDGLHTFLTNKFPLFDGNGKIYAVCGTSVDVTDLKRAEEEKIKLESQNRQLQKAESLGRMAGAIAHTFNNQLGAVIGNLDLAIDDLPEGAGQTDQLTAAMQAAQKAAEVSGQMLTYLGQSFDKHVLMDFAEACRRSLPIIEAAMPGTVVLETSLPSPGPAVMANATEIQQVLTNLLTNAWEAIGEGKGSIHLNVKTVSPADIPESNRVPIDWQPKGSAYACLEITDTGDGITHNDIEILFDPFFSSKMTGRGLGLPVVLGIVKAHDGVVRVESELGRGSTFQVFFPLSTEEVPHQLDKVAHSLTMAGSGTVLLVEDEEMVRNMAAAMLKRLGFSVLAAKDGVEAVEIFRERKDEIRLVLSDLTMPRLNGWETLTALRKLAPEIPVILASGYDEAHVMTGDHPELPQVFLGKPYKLRGLSDAISQALVCRN